MNRIPALAIAVAAWLAPAVQAACLSDVEAAALVANYLHKTPAANPEPAIYRFSPIIFLLYLIFFFIFLFC